MEMPIKATGKWADPRIRSSVNSSNLPLEATGESIKSIERIRTGKNTWAVQIEGDRANTIFWNNAKPGRGRTKKPKRDPLGLLARTASETEKDIAFDQVLMDLERFLKRV